MEDQEQKQKINLNFTLLTGGNFCLSVDSDITVDGLKKIVSKKLKISKDRICLMNSERELQDGTLKENGIVNGSKIIVTPNVETGLAQRAENTVMQALESLNDNQVNDFLSGKSPLNLSVRLGDHMMLIQLQLSTLSPSQQNSLKQRVANSQQKQQQQQASQQQQQPTTIFRAEPPPQPSTSTAASPSPKRACSFDDADDSSSPARQRLRTETPTPALHEDDDDDDVEDESSKSPIKSLSSMVSSPMTTTVQSVNYNKKFWSPSTVADPIAANLTSCLCKRLNLSCNNNCGQRSAADDEPCCSYSSPPPPRPIPFHHRPSTSSSSSSAASTSTSKPPPPTTPTPAVAPVKQQLPPQPSTVPSGEERLQLDANAEQQLISADNPALAEASRSLTQTLRRLSKRVFTNKSQYADQSSSESSADYRSSNSSRAHLTSISGTSGAVIESMKHHGKGIYSGTFSGTLNPALQDKNGRPKRDISTIIHILNDLLSATPQCARNGAKIIFEPTQSTGSTGKYIKVKKQSSSRSSCTRCIGTQTQSQQKCAYGHCNGHLKTELKSAVTSAFGSKECSGCNQMIVNRKLEIENMKTKSKLDQLKLVMQQKKERREARKLKIAPYNNQLSGSLASSSLIIANPLPAASTLQGKALAKKDVTNDLNSSTNSDPSSTSSSATATAIATSISPNSQEIENHLEEVDTVA